ncbi:MAG: hypothetical protein H7061_12705 [Bdellovibrionaceae bacterium]|nr:hypothetical protein [Bdellovibrio sp.]
MLHKIFFIIILFNFSACMKVKKKGDEAKVALPAELGESQENQINKGNQVNYRYIVDGRANYQEVIFSFPADWPSEVIIKKTECIDGAKTSETLVKLDDSKTWKDFLIGDNKTNYQFYKAGSDLKVLDEVEVVPALSLDLTSDLNLAQKYKLNSKTRHIFFKSLKLNANTHLYIEDFSGNLKIDHLLSTQGSLQTFPENAKAKLGVSGRSGGLVKIEILNGEGDFTINMMGEAGGDGFTGETPSIALKGTSGKRGSVAGFANEYATTIITYIKCVAPGGPGTAGGKGSRGNPGKNGLNGGNSGRAIVYKNDLRLQISLYSVAGIKGYGGVGGRGGAGGEGGLGGDGGDGDPPGTPSTSAWAGGVAVSVTSACADGAQGANGPEGDAGVDGHVGVDGTISQSSLYVGGVRSAFANN